MIYISFKKIFIPYVFNEVPDISFDEALKLFNSKTPEEIGVGLRVLFKRYTHKFEVWDAFISYFKNGNIRVIPSYLIYILSHIPWHGDLWDKGKLSEEASQYAKEKIEKFSEEDVIKLLGFIEEGGISRGTIGQCVEAIISIVEKHDSYLKNIILDTRIPIEVRESAVLIYAFYNQKESIDILKKIAGSDYVDEIISYIEEYGSIDLY
ncbi:MAG: hypothetical protein EWM50_08120 [Gottschalkiaceae bacterium]|nr:MAG: hypothetical protein EWM50_08120 [Gottschalkiaceae bacterium]